MAVSRPRREAALGALALATALSLCAAACDRPRQAEAAGPAPPAPSVPSAAEPPAASVPAAGGSGAEPRAPRWVEAKAGGEPVAMTLRLDSHLMVERNVGVTARRDGLVEEILAERGNRVSEGQLLARLDSRELQIAEKAALLELEKQEASFTRARKLRDEAIIPGEEFEHTQLRRDAAAAELERIRHLLTRCEVRAPFDGVISGRFVEKGQFIMEDDRRVLFQVTAMAPLLARVYAPEWALPSLREGQRCTVATKGAVPAAARIRWINDVVDAASGTVEMLVEIADPATAGALRPGLSAEVALPIQADRSAAPAVTLPRAAFGGARLSPGDRLELTLLSANGERSRRWVTLGLAGDASVEIRSGLAAGDRVLLPE